MSKFRTRAMPFGRLEMSWAQCCFLLWFCPLLVLLFLHTFTLRISLSLSLSSPFPLLLGQISLVPWGQMRRPSWLMYRVTTTHSQANRRWAPSSPSNPAHTHWTFHPLARATTVHPSLRLSSTYDHLAVPQNQLWNKWLCSSQGHRGINSCWSSGCFSSYFPT